MKTTLLSKAILRIDQTTRAGRRGATRDYLIHQLVSDLFGQFRQRPFLFRVEESTDDSQHLLILSSCPPTSDRLAAGSGGGIEALETKPYEIDVPAGTRLDYEVRLNATKDVVNEAGRSHRVDVWEAARRSESGDSLTPHDVYGAYLSRKLETCARVDSCRVVERTFARIRKPGGKRSITFVGTNLIGTLEVLQSSDLAATIAAGIGRSKTFGCGLLCLSRPGTVLPRRHRENFRPIPA